MRTGQIILLKERVVSKDLKNKGKVVQAMVIKSEDDRILLAIDFNNPKKYREIIITPEQVLRNTHPRYLIFFDKISLQKYCDKNLNAS